MNTELLKHMLRDATHGIPSDTEVLIIVREKGQQGEKFISMVHNLKGRENAVQMLRQTLLKIDRRENHEQRFEEWKKQMQF